MAVTVTAYNSFFVDRDNAVIDLTDDTIRLALTTSSYTPDQDAHDFFDDITNEVVGTGYTADGEALASKAVTKDNTNDLSKFDADDVVWSTATLTARYGVLYKDTGTPGTSPLIAYVDFGADVSPVGVDLTVAWNASGIMTTTQA